MIRIEHLQKIYGAGDQRVAALDDVSLSVQAGEVFGVLGQSGAGKSTLIRCVNMLERPTSGSVVVDGQEMTALDGASLRQARQKIGMIFQHFNLLSSRTVAENIALPLEVIGMGKQARAARVAELIDLVGLSERASAYPAQLSGGQKQRVGIARALASQPQVLLSDEATSALDPQTTRSILELLRDLNRRLGLTILLITHEMGVVKQICDRVAVLRDGRIAEQGTVAELAAQPGSLLAREIFPQHAEHTPRPGATLVTITYTSGSADEPLLSNLVRTFDIDMNILSGSIELVGGQRIGQMQIELSGEQTAAALAYLRSQNLHVEVRA